MKGYADAALEGNMLALADSVGCNRLLFKSWAEDGAVFGRLDQFLQVWHDLKLPIGSLFSVEAAPLSDIVSESTNLVHKGRGVGPKRTSERLREILQHARKEDEPRSIAEIAADLGYASTGPLYEAQSELCAQITVRYRGLGRGYRWKKNGAATLCDKSEIQHVLEEHLSADQPRPIARISAELGYAAGGNQFCHSMQSKPATTCIRGVVTTSALELGIDIGSLDACVMAGYAGSIASTWQRAGRAGRRNGTSCAVFVASSAPLDQYIVQHPEYFFGSSPEHGHIQPDNLEILVNHLKCSAFELPLSPDEKFGGVDLPDLCERLAEAGFLHQSGNNWHWVQESYPADTISLRSVTSDNFIIIDITGGDAGKPEVIGEVDFTSALTTVHEKAIYIHQGQQYHVERSESSDGSESVQQVNSGTNAAPPCQLANKWRTQFRTRRPKNYFPAPTIAFKTAASTPLFFR